MAKRNNTSRSSKTKSRNDPNQRIEQVFAYFAQENPDVREELANALPAYNMLLSLHAKTFEEFSLMAIAKERGINYKRSLFSYENIKPDCVKCGSSERVSRVKENLYICHACNKKFSLNHNSICSGTNSTSLKWMQVLHCLLEHYTVKRSCRYCGIAPETYYSIRTKLFYAMQILLEEVKLYGLIQCDNTFIHTSYKGIDLTDDEYPEDSIFDAINYIPRAARKRGGGYSHKEKNANSICMFTAIDNYGHCILRYAGIGNPTATKLERAVPFSRYLKMVPSKDPFPLTAKEPNTQEYESKETLLVSDKEAAIRKYAEKMSLPLEAHVYSKNGQQVSLPKGAHNIQRVNALHRRLKDFLRKSNYVSTKHLPGFLVLFEFIENTGATEKAIGRLFEILVTPGLGHSKEFYQSLYTVPDIYSEWWSDNVALKKISYNQMLAAFMYHQKKETEAAGEDPSCTMADIMEATGFQSPNHVRRLYKNMVSAGLMGDICKAMGVPQKLIKREIQKAAVAEVPEQMLQYYDDFCTFLQSPDRDKYTYEEFLSLLNEKYGGAIKRTRFQYYVHRIEDLGIRPVKLSDLKENRRQSRLKEPRVNARWEETFQTYNEVVKGYKNSGQPMPLRDDILRIVGERVGLSYKTVSDHIAAAKRQRKKEK